LAERVPLILTYDQLCPFPFAKLNYVPIARALQSLIAPVVLLLKAIDTNEQLKMVFPRDYAYEKLTAFINVMMFML
jgi:hypothetical protein